MHAPLLDHLARIIRLTLCGPGDPRPQPVKAQDLLEHDLIRLVQLVQPDVKPDDKPDVKPDVKPDDKPLRSRPANGPPTKDQKGLTAISAIRPLTCYFLVAGAGFEPATSGL
jgi:hypothetical protein